MCQPTARLHFHSHEKPLRTCNIHAASEVIKSGKREARPLKTVHQRLPFLLRNDPINTHDDMRALKGSFGKLDKRNESNDILLVSHNRTQLMAR